MDPFAVELLHERADRLEVREVCAAHQIEQSRLGCCEHGAGRSQPLQCNCTIMRPIYTSCATIMISEIYIAGFSRGIQDRYL